MKYSRSWQECYHIVCGKHLRSLYCSDQMWHFGFEWLKVLRGRVTGSCRAFYSTVRKLPYPMLKPNSQHIHLNRNMDTKQTCTPRSKFGSSVQRPGLKSSWLLAPKGPPNDNTCRSSNCHRLSIVKTCLPLKTLCH